MMKKLTSLNPVLLVLGGVVLALILMFAGARLALMIRETQEPTRPQTQGAVSNLPPVSMSELDILLAPFALYPDQLLAQMLLCTSDPVKISELNAWLKSNQTLKGTQLQDAAVIAGFEPSFVALALFPQVVSTMAMQLDSTIRIGKAFAADREAVFASIQRLRSQAQSAGSLKTTPQQTVQTQTTPAGQQVIVIEPANPQIVYVPQYNPQTVYTTQTIIVEEDNDNDEAVAALMGFTAGIVIGAAVDNHYYYGPYGWHGGAYMYNDAWDDYYDARDDARDDWQDHREDLVEERSDRLENTQEQRTERRESTGEERTDRQETRQENRPESQAQRQEARDGTQAQRAQPSAATQTQRAQPSAATQATQTRSSGSYEARGQDRGTDPAAARERSGTRSDAFSGYSSGTSTRAASSRGQGSRSSGGGRRR